MSIFSALLPRPMPSLTRALAISVSCLFALAFSGAAQAVPFSSQSALVIDEDSGKVLLEKNADKMVSIASITKLMTAMVLLDAHPDMEEAITVVPGDVDMLKHSSSRVPVGTTLPRSALLQLAVMSSDNRAAAALARTYPGGYDAFITALNIKIKRLQMHHTVIEEPTGLSPRNMSTATDLIKMVVAAAAYPEIVRASTDRNEIIRVNGRNVEYRNTNQFVGKKGWDIGLSKTGFTTEAGRCIVMRVKSAGKNVVMVLLNASAAAGRAFDAVQVQRFLASGNFSAPAPRRLAQQSAPKSRRASVQAKQG